MSYSVVELRWCFGNLPYTHQTAGEPWTCRITTMQLVQLTTIHTIQVCNELFRLILYLFNSINEEKIL